MTDIGPMLAKYLAKYHAGKATSKGAVESIPGLIRDNPRLAAGIASGMGGGLGAGVEAFLMHKDKKKK